MVSCTTLNWTGGIVGCDREGARELGTTNEEKGGQKCHGTNKCRGRRMSGVQVR